VKYPFGGGGDKGGGGSFVSSWIVERRAGAGAGAVLFRFPPGLTPALGLGQAHDRRLTAMCAYTGPDGRARLVTGGSDGYIFCWDGLTSTPSKVRDPVQLACVVSLTPDESKYLKTRVHPRDAQILAGQELEVGGIALVKHFQHGQAESARHLVAAADTDNRVLLFDPEAETPPLHVCSGRMGRDCWVLQFFGGGSLPLLLSGEGRGTIAVYDAASGALTAVLGAEDDNRVFGAVAYHEPTAGRVRVVALQASAVRVWDLASGELHRAVEMPREEAGDSSEAAMAGYETPDGLPRIVVGGRRSVQVLDPETGTILAEVRIRGLVSWLQVFYAGDGRCRAVSGHEGGRINMWDFGAAAPPEGPTMLLRAANKTGC
jgi:WD40 repeat protein